MKTFLPYILFAGAIMTGCEKVDLYDSIVEEEKSAQIELTINGVDLVNGMTRSYSLNDAEEKAIKTLDVLVFNAAGNLVSRVKLTNPVISSPIRINTKSGSGMSVYAIANANLALVGNGTPNDVLGMATTVGLLKNIKITNMFVDIQNNKTLIMYGVAENVSIAPLTQPATQLPIVLNYVAAKVTVNFYSSISNGDTFQLADWKIGDLARYSYILPRTTDVVDPGNASDYVTQASTNTWEDGSITVGSNTIPVKTTTFYLFENRRGSIPTSSDEKEKSGTNAPAKATHLLARGYYKNSTGVTGLDIKIMFGENSTTDYNIKRGNKYIYNIKVQGINDISVDTRFEGDNIGYQADVVSPTLDAHYDFRPLRIMAYKGTSVIQILNGDGTPVADPANFWLKISPMNITQFVLNGGTYVRPTYNPATDMTLSTTVTNTDLANMTSAWAYLYAEEFLTESGYRTAQVQVTYTPDGASTPLEPTVITLTQRGIMLAGNVGLRRVDPTTNLISSTQYKLGYEVIEEPSISITPGNLANERTVNMQFGNYSGIQLIPLDNKGRRNGFENSQTLVFSNVASQTLRAPYGRTGSAAISYAAWNPIYNTNIARYCFEKNRDVDGNGKIEGAEIKWYLPSIEEQTLIAIGNYAWSPVEADRWLGTGSYSSTQYTSTNAMTSYFPFAQSGSVNATTVMQATRCVRKM